MFELIGKGGYVILVIMVCALAAAAIIVERLLYYYRTDKAAVACRRLLRDPGVELSSLRPETSLFAKMWRAATGLPTADHERLKAVVNDVVQAEVPALERNLYLLMTAATVAPLLGLLGTVLGMIKTFQAASLSGLGNPQMLAEGISEALYNTAGGLLVAIPCIIANNHFRSRVERLLDWAEGCSGEMARQAALEQCSESQNILTEMPILPPCERGFAPEASREERAALHSVKPVYRFGRQTAETRRPS